jgi:hypothetical protein
MARSKTVQVEIPGWLRRFRFPKALDRRLTALLDKQDSGQKLTREERKEAEGLVEVSRVLSLLKLLFNRTTAKPDRAE